MLGDMPSLSQSTGDSDKPSYMTQRSMKNLPPGSNAKGVRYVDGVPDHVLSLVQQEIKGKLKSVLRKKNFFGYPINMPFTDVNMVLERVSLNFFSITLLS